MRPTRDSIQLPRGIAWLAAALIACILAAPGTASAQADPTIVGSLTNFDVRNEMQVEAQGFEIQLEGVELADITRVFGESLAGVCFTRFCAPTVTEFPGGVTIRWTAVFDPATGNRESRLKIEGTIVSASTPVATKPFVTGDECWALGLGAAYPTSGCEHFGVSLLKNPTRTTYRWLVADPFDPANLVQASPVAIPAPTVTVEPLDPSKPQLGNAVQHEIRGERSRTIKQYGEPEWVKVYKLDVGRKVDLEELMRGNPVVPNDTNAEVEWKLLQNNRNSKGNSGVLQSKSGSGSSSHAVVRRYEFYHYTGAVDPDSNEVICADGNCDAPSAGELGSFIGSQMAAANLQAPARLALDKTAVGIGGTVTALVTDGPAKAGDWLGLFDGTGALVTSYRDWKYLNGARKLPDGGVANAVVPFTLPLTVGTYQLRLFDAGSYNVVATSPAITVSAPSVSIDKTTVAAGGTVTATIANGPGGVSDWVGLFDASASAGSYRDWRYLSGSQSKPASGVANATIAFTAPSAPGTYNLRLFANGSLTLVATSASFSVAAAPAAAPTTLSVSSQHVSAGGVVTATIAHGPGRPDDWIGLFNTASGATQYLQWQYLNGSTSAPAAGVTDATLSFTMPALPGTYNLRLFAGATFNVVAASVPITVAAPDISLDRTTVAAGATLTVTIAGAPGFIADWVGVFDAGAPSNRYIEWQYLNASKVKPGTGITNATLSFLAPPTPGVYNVRLFAGPTNVLVATSAAFTVVTGTSGTPPSIALSSKRLSTAATVAATIANGPGNPGDWIGLFDVEGNASSYLSWQYLNGTQTAPANGLEDATVLFALPATPGIYNVRLFAAGTYDLLAVSEPITVLSPTVTVITAGGTVTATVANGPGYTTDWIGLYEVNGAVSDYKDWRWLNNTQRPPDAGLVNATVTFAAPSTPGTYVLRFFAKGSYTLLATSAPFVVP